MNLRVLSDSDNWFQQSKKSNSGRFYSLSQDIVQIGLKRYFTFTIEPSAWWTILTIPSYLLVISTVALSLCTSQTLSKDFITSPSWQQLVRALFSKADRMQIFSCISLKLNKTKPIPKIPSQTISAIRLLLCPLRYQLT